MILKLRCVQIDQWVTSDDSVVAFDLLEVFMACLCSFLFEFLLKIEFKEDSLVLRCLTG